MKPYELDTALDNLTMAIGEMIDLFNKGEHITLDDKLRITLLSAKLENFSDCIYNLA